ncbi:hypothetical protein TNCV_2681061 [Trichonephila clavipes]|uniref:Uncharacterized protein n=1 Tax=Trichonephila clavipes TaxID=2585209 RepID=A0A8X6S3V6_TRICX|nr:hypothetical protein TNCV_2681061 [Trichonephila clavipes]
MEKGVFRTSGRRKKRFPSCSRIESCRRLEPVTYGFVSTNISLDKRDYSCPEAVTGLCRYRHSTLPPVSRWIGERTRYLLLWRACEFDDFVLLRQVGLTTLVALVASRWCHDRSEGFAFPLFSQGHQCRRLEPATYGFVNT